MSTARVLDGAADLMDDAVPCSSQPSGLMREVRVMPETRYSAGSMQVRILSRRYSSLRKP